MCPTVTAQASVKPKAHTPESSPISSHMWMFQTPTAKTLRQKTQTHGLHQLHHTNPATPSLSSRHFTTVSSCLLLSKPRCKRQLTPIGDALAPARRSRPLRQGIGEVGPDPPGTEGSPGPPGPEQHQQVNRAHVSEKRDHSRLREAPRRRFAVRGAARIQAHDKQRNVATGRVNRGR